MKKVLSFVLILAMMLSLSPTAFAETVNTGTSSTTITVNGTYVPAKTISVTVSWENMDFTYTASGWDPDTHQYTGNGAWSTDTKTITVTNHSDVAVNATLGFTPEEGSNVTGTFTGTSTGNTLALATAVGTEVSSAPTASAEFGISGGAITESKKIGTITVTIQAAT